MMLKEIKAPSSTAEAVGNQGSSAVIDRPPPLPESKSAAETIDNEEIAELVTRGERWRYPSGPMVCQATDRLNIHRHKAPLPEIRTSPLGPAVPRRRWLSIFQFGSAGLISFVIHLSVALGLAWHTISTEADPDGDALHVIRVEDVRETQQRSLDTLEFAASSLARAAAASPIANPVTQDVVSSDPDTSAITVSLASFSRRRSGPVGDVSSLFGESCKGLSSIESGDDGAEFFGMRSGGNRFVFVVDCSRSMSEGGRWYDATRELTAAIERLGPTQSFYVIFFDGESHPMFSGTTPEPELLPATEENLARFHEWIQTIRLGAFTRPAKSMLSALRLKPDAIYLLSDGVFEDQTGAILRKTNLTRENGRKRPEVVVNTIGFHTRDGQKVLQRIADENGGRYIFVPDA